MYQRKLSLTMGNARRVQQRYITVVEQTNKFRPGLLATLGLMAVLGGLTGLNPLVGLASASALFLLVLVIPRPVLVVYGLAFIMPLVGGLVRGGVIPFLRLGQALLVVGCIFFILSRPTLQGKGRLTAIDLAFAFFFLTEAAFPVLALLYRGEYLDLNSTGYYNQGTPLQTLLGPLQYYLLYRIVMATISSEKQIVTVLKLSFIASIIVSIIGILQKLEVAPVKIFLDTYYPSTVLHPGLITPATDLRITSTLESNSGLAAYLCFTLIVALACYTAQEQLKISPLLLAATLLLDSIALILTGTIAAFIGLTIGAVIVFLLVGRLPRLVFFIPVGIALTVFIFPSFIVDRLAEWFGSGGQSLLPTFAERIRLWREIFLPAIGQHLFFGSGPAPAVDNLWVSEESQYFALLLRGGLLYLFSYILLIRMAIVSCWRQIKGKSEDISQLVAIAALAILIAMSFMNVSAVYFTYVGGTQILWTLLAIVVASRQFKAAGSPTTDLVSRSIKPETSRQKQHLHHLVRLRRLLDWRFVKDSTVVGTGSTFARVLGLLFSILLAHFLTPNYFGFYRY